MWISKTTYEGLIVCVDKRVLGVSSALILSLGIFFWHRITRRIHVNIELQMFTYFVFDFLFLYGSEYFLKCSKRFVVLSLVKFFSACVKRFKSWIRRNGSIFESGAHHHLGRIRSRNSGLSSYCGRR